MSHRLRRAFGNIQLIQKGVYRLRWTDAGRRKSCTVRGTRADAERRLAEIQIETDTHTPKMRTVGELWESALLPDLQRSQAPRTLVNSKSCWNKHVAPAWSHVYVDEIRASTVQDWLLGLPPQTAKVCLYILRGIMRQAVIFELVDHSPLEIKFTLPTSKTKHYSAEIIHDEPSIAAYLAAVHGRWIEAPIILMLCGGLRVGESLGVQAADITRHTANGQPCALIHVTRQADKTGGVVTNADGTERLKTKTSNRYAAVIGEPASRLFELQDNAASDGHIYMADDGTGRPIGTDALRRAWREALKLAGLPSIDLRNLRPSFATAAHHGGGIATEDIARLLGHSRPNITFRTYQRPNADDVLKLFQ